MSEVGVCDGDGCSALKSSIGAIENARKELGCCTHADCLPSVTTILCAHDVVTSFFQHPGTSKVCSDFNEQCEALRVVKKPQVKVKQDPVCKQVPVERCTTSKQCDQVSVEKCEKVPVETCNQVPNTKCRSIPQEICNVVTNKHCKKVPHQTCENVAHPRCVSIPHKVCEIIPEEKCRKEPSETCWEEPVQKCHQVPEERCWQEPHQSCRDEPRDICHDKTVRLEKKVCVHETKKTEVPTW